jgi:hypothetical protein
MNWPPWVSQSASWIPMSWEWVANAFLPLLTKQAKVGCIILLGSYFGSVLGAIIWNCPTWTMKPPNLSQKALPMDCAGLYKNKKLVSLSSNQAIYKRIWILLEKCPLMSFLKWCYRSWKLPILHLHGCVLVPSRDIPHGFCVPSFPCYQFRSQIIWFDPYVAWYILRISDVRKIRPCCILESRAAGLLLPCSQDNLKESVGTLMWMSHW